MIKPFGIPSPIGANTVSPATPTMFRVVPVEFKIVRPGAEVPKYATDGAAAVDLYAHLERPVYLHPGETIMIPTGIAINIGDPGIAAFIYPRSGRATKEGLTLKNTVGVIDADYQGEIFVAAYNKDVNKHHSIYIKPGERIAQMVFAPALRAALIEVKEFDAETKRGAGGFGSTGV